MSVVRRWQAECPDCGGRGTITEYAGGYRDVTEACALCEGEGGVVVVPDSLHRGAVEETERLREHNAALYRENDALRRRLVALGDDPNQWGQ